MRGAALRGIAFGVPWSIGASCSKGFLQKYKFRGIARRKLGIGTKHSCKRRGIEKCAEGLLAKSGNFQLCKKCTAPRS
jgi:hypothetical protein